MTHQNYDIGGKIALWPSHDHVIAIQGPHSQHTFTTIVVPHIYMITIYMLLNQLADEVICLIMEMEMTS